MTKVSQVFGRQLFIDLEANKAAKASRFIRCGSAKPVGNYYVSRRFDQLVISWSPPKTVVGGLPLLVGSPVPW
jgi:hypothetical protein